MLFVFPHLELPVRAPETTRQAGLIFVEQQAYGSVCALSRCAYSDTAPVGTVVNQNVEAGTEIPINSKIYLQISLGPETTPTPTPKPTATPVPEDDE